MDNSITVIITCFNLERYIGSAIESVLAQQFDGKIEIVVVDDCSTDKSGLIVSTYPQVKLLRTPANCGVLLATVLGLRAANHDLVAFLDGDDLWRSDKLRKIADAFASHPNIGLVTHDLRYIDSKGFVLPRVSRPSQVMPSEASGCEYDQLIRQGILEQGDYVWLGSAYAIRRGVVDANGFCEFAERLPDPSNTYQDWPLAVWCAAQTSVRLGYVHEKLFDYRLHHANHSGDARTPEKAIRNFNRALNTTLAIDAVLRRFGSLSARASLASRRKCIYNQYVLDLYRGRRFAALRGFFASQGYLLQKDVSAWKEYIRFFGVQILGTRRFLGILKR